MWVKSTKKRYEKKPACFSLISVLLDIFVSRAVSYCFDYCPENASVMLFVQPPEQQQQYLSGHGIHWENAFPCAKGNKQKHVTRLTEMETSCRRQPRRWGEPAHKPRVTRAEHGQDDSCTVRMSCKLLFSCCLWVSWECPGQESWGCEALRLLSSWSMQWEQCARGGNAVPGGMFITGMSPTMYSPWALQTHLLMLHLVNLCGKMWLPQSIKEKEKSDISWLWNRWGGNQMWFCAIMRADTLTWECLSEGCCLLFLVMCNLWIIFCLWIQWYNVWNVSLVQSASLDASEDFLLAETAFPCFVCSVYACAFAVKGYFRLNKISSLEDGICGCHLWRLVWLFIRAHNSL